MQRTILHIDLDAFFCSVELLRNPALEGKPFIVGGKPGSRGVVASASYSARTFGIHSAMPTSQAVRLCPELVIVPSSHGNYEEYSDNVMSLLRDSAPIVEQISIDEAFLDVSDAPESGESLARELQIDIGSRFGLPTSWGVATSKLVAKIGSEIGKPKGLVVIPPGGEANFLAPLPVDMLWGIGPKSRDRFHKSGIKTIGDLAALSSVELSARFGERGLELAGMARGVDRRKVHEGHTRRSISSERTFPRNVSDETELLRMMRSISEDLGARLRKKGLAGITIRLKLRWPNFETMTRQIRLDQPTDQDAEIYTAAVKLFKKSWKKGQKVRLLGVGVANLGLRIRQLDLFDRSWEKDERLLDAIDKIRARFGGQALTRARNLEAKVRRQEEDP